MLAEEPRLQPQHDDGRRVAPMLLPATFAQAQVECPIIGAEEKSRGGVGRLVQSALVLHGASAK